MNHARTMFGVSRGHPVRLLSKERGGHGAFIGLQAMSLCRPLRSHRLSGPWQKLFPILGWTQRVVPLRQGRGFFDVE